MSTIVGLVSTITFGLGLTHERRNKKTDYVPRFEEALDIVKTEMENKIEQLSEKDGNDFEIALRMLGKY